MIGVDAATRTPGRTISVGGTTTTVSRPPTTSGASSVGDRFVPPTTSQDGLVVLPVTLPDGETFTLRYPPAMRIAQLGFAGGIGVDWPVETGDLQCCGKQRSASGTTRSLTSTATRSRSRCTTGRTASACRSSTASDAITSAASPAVDELVFQFGPWLVRVQDVQHPGDYADRMTDAQRATWARSLTGRVDSNGYLVLHAKAPLTLTDHSENRFGSPATEANGLEIASHLYCGETGSDTSARRRFVNGDGSRGVSWCSPGPLHLSATGSRAFIDLAANELQVSPLTPPVGGTDTTSPTTTTTPTKASKPFVVPPPFAVSASFVSATTGWALEQGATCGDVCDFHVVQTTNGGSTWAQVGKVRLPTYSTRIRFADPSHGFVFDAENRRAAPLRETDDGGSHWKTLKTPFQSISDLAISRGTIYVVGVPASPPHTTSPAFPGFRIWSSPVNPVHWTMDPLVIPAGAGPIPEQQLVLAGNGGWMINSDRGIVSGARLSPASGRWSPWTPPCGDVKESASLSASTSSDLAAVCSPGFATSSTKTYIEFSHDAGTTFDRHLVPGGSRRRRTRFAERRYRGDRPEHQPATNDRRRRDLADRDARRQPSRNAGYRRLRDHGRLRVHDHDAGVHRLRQRPHAHDARRRRDLAAGDAPVSTNPLGRSRLSVVAAVLGAVALAACGSSTKSTDAARATTTTTSTPTSTSNSGPAARPPRAHRPPSRRSTTAPYYWKGEPVMSASFVSPQVGWALEVNGRIDPTTDGGASWGSTGVIDLRQYREVPTQIRFADATHGFIFNREALWGSTDRATAGSSSTTPFSNVYDLRDRRAAWCTRWRGTRATRRSGSGLRPLIGSRGRRTRARFTPGPDGPHDPARLRGTGAARSSKSTGPRSGARPRARRPLGRVDAAVHRHERAGRAHRVDQHRPRRIVQRTRVGRRPITPAVYFSHDGGTTFHGTRRRIYGLVASPIRHRGGRLRRHLATNDRQRPRPGPSPSTRTRTTPTPPTTSASRLRPRASRSSVTA